MGGSKKKFQNTHKKKNGGREYVGGINKQYFIFKADSERGKKKKSSLDGKAARLFNGLRQLFMHLFIGRVGWQVQPIEACVRLG